MSEKTPQKDSPNTASFEQSLNELERTVAQMESGNLGLEETLVLYEKGMQLSKRCERALNEAEMRIKIITEQGEEKDGTHLLEKTSNAV